jgi:peptidoglycan/LPS O-acetylase OafA/YrhL
MSMNALVENAGIQSRSRVSPGNSLEYRPDIDGLRAVAVIAVLLFHAELHCPGGFVGVDMFFVISGFLISSLILKELDDGSFSLVNFWERRIRRILPAVTVVVLGTLVAGWFLYLPADFASLGKSVVAQAALVSNIFFYQQAGYFEAGADTTPLLHTWSLAVEEQFYLIFPLFLVFLSRFRRRSRLAAIVVVAAASFASSVLGTYAYPRAAFYLLPTRAWELLLGALLAMTRGRVSVNSWIRETSAWMGLGLVACSVVYYDGSTRFPGLAAAAPCLGTQGDCATMGNLV